MARPRTSADAWDCFEGEFVMRVSIARISVLGVSAAVACLGISIDAQAPRAGAAKSAKMIARTPDGHPDLQGIYDFSTATPLERPSAGVDA